jgi:hypothetical protein
MMNTLRNSLCCSSKNIHWNSKYLADHPAVVNFRRHIIEILAKNDDHSLVGPFVIGFNYLIEKDSTNDPVLVKFKDKLATNEIQEELSKYLEGVVSLLWEQPSIIDNKTLSSYYIENKAYESPIANWEENCQNAPTTSSSWKITEFLKSKYLKVVIGAPFGIGKTSLAKKFGADYALKYLNGEETWIPIFVPLRNKLENVYLDWSLKKVIDELIKSLQSDKKILLILDGLDEYNGDINNLLEDVDKILGNIRYKTLITTRLEPEIPDKLSINKFVRLFPFTKTQVNEFFSKSKYNIPEVKYQTLEKYGLQDEKEGVKPLFCWMFGVIYDKSGPEKYTQQPNVGKSLLYLNFVSKQSSLFTSEISYKNFKNYKNGHFVK